MFQDSGWYYIKVNTASFINIDPFIDTFPIFRNNNCYLDNIKVSHVLLVLRSVSTKAMVLMKIITSGNLHSMLEVMFPENSDSFHCEFRKEKISNLFF